MSALYHEGITMLKLPKEAVTDVGRGDVKFFIG